MAHKTYKKETSGDTAVLFIHGFLGSPEHFERFIAHIPFDVAVFNILLSGHGGTVMDFGNASMKEWQKQSTQAVEELFKKYKNVYIVAHSMGTFFAMDAVIRHPEIKGIFLMQTPLKIGVKSAAVINTIKSLFNIFDEDDTSAAYKAAHSVKLNFRVWEYISWIPRYIELFRESKRARSTILSVKTPCRIFQSKNDELVSIKSVKFIPEKENISLFILEKSAHFIYTKKEEEFLIERFLEMLTNGENSNEKDS